MKFTKINLPSKICKSCNRPFNWRKKWKKTGKKFYTVQKNAVTIIGSKLSKFIVYFSTVIFLIILFTYLEYFSLDFFKTTYIHIEGLVQKIIIIICFYFFSVIFL